MKTKLLVFLGVLSLVILANCRPVIPPDGNGPATPTQANSGFMVTPFGVIPEKVSPFDIQEVGVGDNSYVSLTNFTDQPGSLNGFYLCQGKSCFALPDKIVPASETVRVAVGAGNDLQNVVAANASFGKLRPEDGEIALTNSAAPDAPEKIMIYLEWGSTPHELTALAIKAGLWLKGSYAPTSSRAIRLYRVKESGLWLFEEPPQ